MKQLILKQLILVYFFIFLVLIGNCFSFLDNKFTCKEFYEYVENHYKKLRGINWISAKSGVILQENDALLVCKNSQAFLRTDESFNLKGIWKKGKEFYIGVVEESQMAVIPKDLKVQINKIEGKVFYTKDKEHIKKADILGLDFGEKRINKEMKEEEEFLKSLSWLGTEEGMRLKEWSIVKVSSHSTVTLKISKGDIWINAPEFKEFNDTLIIPEDTYIIIIPEMFRSAEIVNIEGEVYFSEEYQKVKNFYLQKGTFKIHVN